MIKIRISEKDAGQRMDKYLHKYLAKSTSGFLYKMLRKKNITLNGKKAAGNEMLQKEDEITLFLSDETILKFGGIVPDGGIYDGNGINSSLQKSPREEQRMESKSEQYKKALIFWLPAKVFPHSTSPLVFLSSRLHTEGLKVCSVI